MSSPNDVTQSPVPSSNGHHGQTVPTVHTARLAERLLELMQQQAWAGFRAGRTWWWRRVLLRWFGVFPGSAEDVRRETQAVVALTKAFEEVVRAEVAEALRREEGYTHALIVRLPRRGKRRAEDLVVSEAVLEALRRIGPPVEGGAS